MLNTIVIWYSFFLNSKKNLEYAKVLSHMMYGSDDSKFAYGYFYEMPSYSHARIA